MLKYPVPIKAISTSVEIKPNKVANGCVFHLVSTEGLGFGRNWIHMNFGNFN